MKILVIADIHGEMGALSAFLSGFNEKVDLVVCPGDFTNMYNTPPQFAQIDMAELILQQLIAMGPPLLCVPGNHDLYETTEVLEEYGVSLQDSAKAVGGMTFIGWGGALTPFRTNIEPTEEETKAALAKLANGAKPPLVLVVHNPPHNTKLDKIKEGDHVGSKAIREFITSNKPLLCISAHIQEAFGEDKIGDTTLFYPGALSEGRYGLVEIDPKTKSVKIELREFKLPKKKTEIDAGELF